jgi:antibiotic biosynthesis monooxygenase (ABM) superfamily enzyme
MTTAIQEMDESLLQIRGVQASSVIVQRIPAGSEEVYLEWQRGISAAASKFPGYQTTEIFPPWGKQEEWVAIIHFDDSKTLQNWLDSPTRSQWVERLPKEIRDFHLKMLPSGFGGWFAGQDDDGKPLPHWKMFITVLFGLYPTVMLLYLYLLPHTQRFGPAIAMLIGNAVSVAFLEWLGMPVINWLLGPWLRANGKNSLALSLLGLAMLSVALVLMSYGFHLLLRSP